MRDSTNPTRKRAFETKSGAKAQKLSCKGTESDLESFATALLGRAMHEPAVRAVGFVTVTGAIPREDTEERISSERHRRKDLKKQSCH